MQTMPSQSPQISSQPPHWPGTRIVFVMLLCAGFAFAAFLFFLMFHTVIMP